MPESPDSGVWTRTSPVAMVFFVGTTARKIIDGYGQVAATIGVTAFLVRNPEYAALVVTIGSVAILAVAFLRYWRFRFRIDEDRILIREGVLNRTALDLPFERIQGINVQRRLVERVVGLVTVVLDTAGSTAAEGRLRTVRPEVADRLLERVAENREGLASDGPTTFAEARPGSGERPPVAAEAPVAASHRHRLGDPRKILQTLTTADLFRMGLTRPRGLFLAVLLALLGTRSDRVKDAVNSAFGAARDTVEGLDPLSALLAAAGLVVAWVVVSRVGGVAGTVREYHRFTLWREGRSYRTRAGLLTQNEVVVRMRKVQMVRLYQDLLQRWLRRYGLETPPIGDSPDEDDSRSEGPDAEALEVPWADDALVKEIRSDVFRSEGERLALIPTDPAFRSVSPHYIRAAAVRFVILGWGSGMLVLYLSTYIWLYYVGYDALEFELLRGLGIAALVWGGVCAAAAIPIGWQRWRRRGYMFDEDGLSSRGGLLGYEVEAFLFRKAQEVTVRRSPMQRRHGLATLEVGTACGPVSIPYIEHGLACRLRDYILYRAETNHRWH